MCRYWLRQLSRGGTLLRYFIWRLLDKFWNRWGWSRGYPIVPRGSVYPHGWVHEKIYVTAKVTIGLSWINHTLLCAKGSVYAHGRVHEKISVTAKVNLLLACPEWTILCCTQRFSIPAWTSTFIVGLSWMNQLLLYVAFSGYCCYVVLPCLDSSSF